jgi:hypothetical protein
MRLPLSANEELAKELSFEGCQGASRGFEDCAAGWVWWLPKMFKDL